MANPYYSNSQNLTAGTRARASAVEAELDAVEAGFDQVYSLVAPKASPTFTGNVSHSGGTVSLGGNTSVTGTFSSSGNATVGGTLGVTGATTLSSTLAVTGAATFSSSITAASAVISGAATIGTTLDVTGAATFSSTVSVTGALTAATPASLAEDSTRVPTTAWVQDVIAAATFTATLPGQGGNGGKFLTTDGANASWGAIPDQLPSQTGNSGKFLTTNGTAASWAEVNTGITVVEAEVNGTITMPAADGDYVVLCTNMPFNTSPAVASIVITLPDMTQRSKYSIRVIPHLTVTSATLQDEDGNAIFRADSTADVYHMICHDFSKKQGSWFVEDSSAAGREARGGPEFNVLTIGASLQTSAGYFPMSIDIPGSRQLTVDTSASSGARIVDKTTGKVGGAVNIITASYPRIFSAGGNLVLVSGSSRMTLVDCGASGTTATFLAGETPPTTFSHGYWTHTDKFSDTMFVQMTQNTVGAGAFIRAVEVTSGPVLTAGSPVSIGANTIPVGVVSISSTVGLAFYLKGASAPYTVAVRDFTLSGTTITLGTEVTYATTTSQTTMFVKSLGNGVYGVFDAAPQGRFGTWSGGAWTWGSTTMVTFSAGVTDTHPDNLIAVSDTVFAFVTGTNCYTYIQSGSGASLTYTLVTTMGAAIAYMVDYYNNRIFRFSSTATEMVAILDINTTTGAATYTGTNRRIMTGTNTGVAADCLVLSDGLFAADEELFYFQGFGLPCRQQTVGFGQILSGSSVRAHGRIIVNSSSQVHIVA